MENEIDLDQLSVLEKASVDQQVNGLSEAYLSVRTQLTHHNKLVDPMNVGENLVEDILSERAMMLDKFTSKPVGTKSDYELLKA